MRDLFGRSQWLIGAGPGNQTLDLFDEDLCWRVTVPEAGLSAFLCTAESS